MELGVSVVGLGKLGSCMAAAFAARGARVVGVDIDPRAVAAIDAGGAPVEEPGLAELVNGNRDRLRATMDLGEAVRSSGITFVIVPTPSEPSGAFSLDHVASAFREIGRALRDRDAYHTVVLTSTVLPGSTRHALLPLLERESGKECGVGFGLCYSPAFIALGSVIRDFTHPDLVLIGESDARAGDALEECYRSVLEGDPPVRRMSIENAELVKLALNTFVTVKITFANMIADLCERIPGGDADVVADALGLDRRIGRHYLRGGTGYGGPCFPRDNQALGFIARELGTEAPLADATDRSNRAAAARVLRLIEPELRPGTTALVLGLAYKPGTPVIEESAGVALARDLVRAGVRVLAYDPLANGPARAALGGAVEVVDSLGAALPRAELVVVATPDPAFRAVRPDLLAHGAVVVDCWRLLEARLADAPGVRYRAVGRSVDDAAGHERMRRLWGGAAERGAPEPLPA